MTPLMAKLTSPSRRAHRDLPADMDPWVTLAQNIVLILARLVFPLIHVITNKAPPGPLALRFLVQVSGVKRRHWRQLPVAVQAGT